MQDGRLKAALKQARDVAETVTTRVTGEPPRRIRRGISPLWFDYTRTGRDQLEFFTELAGLRPTDRVLDIGCGVGRIARPLTGYLSGGGSYDGFDILPYMIEWDRQNISATYPNFRFHLAEIASSTNNQRDASLDAAEYRFAFGDDTFDFAYAGSLFTHLTPGGTENYLAETARTLKAGGRLVATFNLYNEQTQARNPGRNLTVAWPHDMGHYRLKEKDAPESNVAYEEGYLRQAYKRAGLSILEPLRPDASYSPARAPKRGQAPHLWYSVGIIAIKD
jgi:SAM-dependent methyltransferase